MDNTFERPIKISFTPMAGNTPLDIYSIEAVRIYESKPSDTQLADITNSNLDFVSGSTTTSDFVQLGNCEWELTLPAITHPAGRKELDYDLYYYAINFKHTISSNSVSCWEAFAVWYPDGTAGSLQITPKEIGQIESQILDEKEDAWIYDKIRKGEEIFFARLNAQGLKRNLIREKDLRVACIYLITAMCCQDILPEAGDRWDGAAIANRDLYETKLSELKVHKDINQDNIIEDEYDEISPVSNVVIR